MSKAYASSIRFAREDRRGLVLGLLPPGLVESVDKKQLGAVRPRLVLNRASQEQLVGSDRSNCLDL